MKKNFVLSLGSSVLSKLTASMMIAMVLVAPISSCSGAVVVQELSSEPAEVSVSESQGEASEGYAMASIQNTGAEKVSEPVTEPTVSVDLSKIQFRSMPVSEARSRMVRSLAKRGLASPRMLSRSETGAQAAGDSEFALDGEQPPTEQERASYDAMVGALSGSPLLEQDALNEQIVSSIDS